MMSSVSRFASVAWVLAALVLGGCLPSPSGQVEEEKEPHFLEGRQLVNAMDYSGAIESFEKALEINPLSASAHFELASLYDGKEPDAAAAIYHYEKFLKLRPGADKTNVKDRINACKGELARGVSLAPVSEKQQRDLEKLTIQTQQLTEENKRLNQELAKWRAYYAGQQQPQANPGDTVTARSRDFSTGPGPVSGSVTNGPPTGDRSGGTHTHRVQSGDTASRIARQYGVKLTALLEANPRLDPRRMRPGQSLVIP